MDLEEVILPGNARLFHHDAECFDWGTLGWIMSAGMVDVQDYKYFVMVNSGVRGPYAPPYEPVRRAAARVERSGRCAWGGCDGALGPCSCPVTQALQATLQGRFVGEEQLNRGLTGDCTCKIVHVIT